MPGVGRRGPPLAAVAAARAAGGVQHRALEAHEQPQQLGERRRVQRAGSAIGRRPHGDRIVHPRHRHLAFAPQVAPQDRPRGAPRHDEPERPRRGPRGEATEHGRPPHGAARRAPGRVDEKRASFEREALVHLDSLYRVALRLTGNAADADDLVQETMLKAYRAWDQYEKGTNAKGWLLTILRNAFINEYRRRTRHPETVDLDTIEPYSVFSDVQDDDPQGTFFDSIVDDEVLRAIDQLPEQFRETVVLSDVEGLSYEEIARIIDVPVGTVKSRLFRARRLLQRKLYDYAVGMGYIKANPA